MRSPKILILPDDHAAPALRWSVVSHMPRRQATVYARWKLEAQLLGSQLMGVAPGLCVAVESPAFLPSLDLA